MSNIFDDMTGGNVDDHAGDGSDVPAEETAGPTGYTARGIKAAVQELLKFGLLEADRKGHLYRTATTHHERINEILEPLDLTLRIDDVRGLAFLVVAEGMFDAREAREDSAATADDDWSHPLVRRQRLTLEQSLVVAILRQVYLVHEQEAGTGAGSVTVPVEELLSSLQLYVGSSGSDAKDQKRIRNLLENVRAHGIVSEIDDKDQVAIRPIITHLANPESLQALLEHFKSVADEGKQL